MGEIVIHIGTCTFLTTMQTK